VKLGNIKDECEICLIWMIHNDKNLTPNEIYLNMMKIQYFNDLTKLWKL